MTEPSHTLLPYQGIATFLKAAMSNQATEQTIMAFMGLPYDCSTSFRSGARMAPNAIRQASMMLTDGDHPIFRVDPVKYIVDMGDAAIGHVSSIEASDDVCCYVKAILQKNYIPLLAGGDHSVSLGILRAYREQNIGPINLIHFDAHADTWDGAWVEKRGHGTWVRDAVDDGLLDPRRVLQIGIRSPIQDDIAKWLPKKGGFVMSARECMTLSEAQIRRRFHAHIHSHFPDENIEKTPLYISFDIDALDPAYAPGTGTPEIGGLTSLFALQIIEELSGYNLIGMDVVEVCPAYDPSQITALAAATLLWTFASLIAAKRSIMKTDIPPSLLL